MWFRQSNPTAVKLVSYLTINGVNINYDVQGHGIPIIFIHPPVLSSVSFKNQTDGLSHLFMTVCFDIRGHGGSQPTSKPLTYSMIVEDIKHLMDHLNIDKAYLCGYSTGGSVVLEFLLTYPEKTFGGIVVGGMSEVHDLRLACRIFLGMITARIGAITPLALGLALSNSNNGTLLWQTYQEAKRGNTANMEQYYRFSLNYNCTTRLGEIQSPVLLVYGLKDKGFHSYGRLLHDALPKSELVLVKNMKHQIPTKAAYELNERITKFIESHEPVMW